MGLSKTEINLRRLLAAAPQQQNQAKLVHYVTTMREQLEQLGRETSSDGLTRISKAKLNEYSERIEAFVTKLATPVPQLVDVLDETTSVDENNSRIHETSGSVASSSGLRRRFATPIEPGNDIHEIREKTSAMSVKLDDSTQAHVEKHRQLQEDLTDEMVVLAQQLKESSLMMSQSLQETEKLLSSTEQAVEHSIAGTGRANTTAAQVFSETSKTTCFTWLLIFFMTFMFVMVVLLIRVT